MRLNHSGNRFRLFRLFCALRHWDARREAIALARATKSLVASAERTRR
jgi:hypothetical protein